MHVFFDEWLRLAQKFRAKKHDRGRAVPNFGILRQRNVDERLGRRVDNIQEVHNRRTIVRDGRLVPRVDELVHAAWSERRAHGLHHGLARIDVTDQLRFPLARVRALLEQNDLRLLHSSDTQKHTCRK